MGKRKREKRVPIGYGNIAIEPPNEKEERKKQVGSYQGKCRVKPSKKKRRGWTKRVKR